MYSLPGSTPPSTSITKSIESSSTISLISSVNKLLSTALSFEISETRTFVTLISTMSVSSSCKRVITAEPIFPAPNTATE